MKGITIVINKMTPFPIKPIFLYIPFSANNPNINPNADEITPIDRKLSLPNKTTMYDAKPIRNNMVENTPSLLFIFISPPINHLMR